jgi:membrane protease YdiL (CAAX protease family)
LAARVTRPDDAFAVRRSVRRAVRPGGERRAAVVLLVGVLAVILAANLATNLLPARWYVPVCVLGSVAVLVLGALDGLSAAELGIAAGTLLPGLLWAALLVAAVVLVYAAGAAWPRSRKAFADQRAMNAGGPEIAFRLFVAIPFGTVLLEESAFRGVLFGMLENRGGTGWAIAVTSALFGLWHVLPARVMHRSHDAMAGTFGHGSRGRALAIAGTVLFTAAGGVVFAVLRVWTGSLLPPIGLHWALNGMGVALAWWLARLTARSAEAGDAGARGPGND